MYNFDFHMFQFHRFDTDIVPARVNIFIIPQCEDYSNTLKKLCYHSSQDTVINDAVLFSIQRLQRRYRAT